jgi:hypothetical protein
MDFTSIMRFYYSHYQREVFYGVQARGFLEKPAEEDIAAKWATSLAPKWRGDRRPHTRDGGVMEVAVLYRECELGGLHHFLAVRDCKMRSGDTDWSKYI